MDIDGVLNSERTTQAFATNFWFDSVSCRLLMWLLRATGSKIVIISDWRPEESESTERFYRWWNQSFQNKDDLQRLTSAIVGFTGRSSSRSLEIQNWLANNPTDDFVVIDDYDDWTKNTALSRVFKGRFVLIDSYIGLSANDVEEALRILMRV